MASVTFYKDPQGQDYVCDETTCWRVGENCSLRRENRPASAFPVPPHDFASQILENVKDAICKNEEVWNTVVSRFPKDSIVLDLRDWVITHLPPELATHFPHLQQIYIGENAPWYIPSDLDHVEVLTNVDLADDPLMHAQQPL